MTEQTNIETLQAYREQKHKTEQLAEAARAGLQSQYTGLLSTAAEIQKEFKADFGETPVLPPCVKTFTLVPVEGKTKPPQSEAAAKGKKIGGLRRSLTAAMKKGDKAKQEELVRQLAGLGADMSMHADLSDPLAGTTL